MSVTVVIAARNEERLIAAAIDSAFAAGAAEVIVCDGASTDSTRQIARDRGACVIECEPMRARQFNRGAAAAANDAIIFLHADTTLPPAAAAAVEKALQTFAFGGFRVRFAENAIRLRIAAAMINLRTRLTCCPWGDQAQFIERQLFLASGGFRDMPIMEDYELAIRMRRRATILRQTVTTSGRRFLEKGVLRTAAINWFIILRWRLGTDAETLARVYRS